MVCLDASRNYFQFATVFGFGCEIWIFNTTYIQPEFVSTFKLHSEFQCTFSLPTHVIFSFLVNQGVRRIFQKKKRRKKEWRGTPFSLFHSSSINLYRSGIADPLAVGSPPPPPPVVAPARLDWSLAETTTTQS